MSLLLSLLTLMEFCSVIQQTQICAWWLSAIDINIFLVTSTLWSEFLLARPLDYSKHLWWLLTRPADLWPDHLPDHLCDPQLNHPSDHLITCVIACLHNDQTIASKCERSELKKRKQPETCTKDVNKITRAPPSRLWGERWAGECDHKLTWERPTHQAINVPFSNKHLLLLARPPEAQRWAGAAFMLSYQVSFGILTNLGWFGWSKHGGL